ncbi:MAG: tRNA lysidine(34) synthetase TilS [Pseudomonadota bacterium]|nr:tRNA lysidine(34) synthetase TilS [Pseudomonadota bacterium]
MAVEPQTELTVRVADFLKANIAPVSPDSAVLWVGVSGGVDSIALLDLMSRAQVPQGWRVAAVHANHALSPEADAWQTHCAHVAATLGIEFHTNKLNVPTDGNLEANAREARYAYFRSMAARCDVVLTAHHADDQLETVLLKLFQGRGFTGIQAVGRTLGVSVLRPLLNVPRATLEGYCEMRGLEWIEDPSNQDQRYDRNYLRHEIVPLLKKRWPDVPGRIQRVLETSAALVSFARREVAHRPDLCLDELPEEEGAAVILIRLYLENAGHFHATDAALAAFLVRARAGQRARLHVAGASLVVRKGKLMIDQEDIRERR